MFAPFFFVLRGLTKQLFGVGKYVALRKVFLSIFFRRFGFGFENGDENETNVLFLNMRPGFLEYLKSIFVNNGVSNAC